MNRIEVLAGPQGTLFGASSQAGTVRLITNKPDFSGTYGNVKLGTAFTKGGEMSNSATGVFNTQSERQAGPARCCLRRPHGRLHRQRRRHAEHPRERPLPSRRARCARTACP
jgi:hypothetical protein